MPLAAGTRLGPYEVIAPIGAGEMGEVHRVRDTRLGREVAIKILPATVSDDPDRLRRFEQEARAAGSLNHPNILVVHDVGDHDRAPYLVCELLEGTTLREQLNGAPMPPRRSIDYAVQIANGLAAAHGRSIVHRRRGHSRPQNRHDRHRARRPDPRGETVIRDDRSHSRLHTCPFAGRKATRLRFQQSRGA